jgi:hypothetical protein
MKKTLIFVLAILFFFSCKKGDHNLQTGVNLKPNLLIVLDSFVKTMPLKNKYNEIYIDKVDPHIYSIILYSGNNSLTEKEIIDNKLYPCNFTNRNGVKFYIFSGIEKYFSDSDTTSQVMYKKNNNFDSENMKLWIVLDSFNIIKAKSFRYAYPYMSLPARYKSTKELEIRGCNN